MSCAFCFKRRGTFWASAFCVCEITNVLCRLHLICYFFLFLLCIYNKMTFADWIECTIVRILTLHQHYPQINTMITIHLGLWRPTFSRTINTVLVECNRSKVFMNESAFFKMCLLMYNAMLGFKFCHWILSAINSNRLNSVYSRINCHSTGKKIRV